MAGFTPRRGLGAGSPAPRGSAQAGPNRGAAAAAKGTATAALIRGFTKHEGPREERCSCAHRLVAKGQVLSQ